MKEKTTNNLVKKYMKECVRNNLSEKKENSSETYTQNKKYSQRYQKMKKNRLKTCQKSGK